MADVDVVTAYSTRLPNGELEVPRNLGKDALYNIVQLYTRMRSYSFAKDIIQKHKAAYKEISRASHPA